jgi:hypothetical protein
VNGLVARLRLDRILPLARRLWLAMALGILALLAAAPSALAQSGAVAVSPRDVPDLGAPSADPALVPQVPASFVVRDAGWIRFAYPASAHGRVQPLVEAAIDVREALASELGRPVLERLEVRIVRSFDEMTALAPVGFPPPDYAVGVAYARFRLVLISLVAPGSVEPPVLPEVFRHELAHVALHDAVGGRPVPRWFNEGFAVHASGESSMVRAKTLWSATLSKRLLPMGDLDRSFPASSDLASVAYAQSADFVRFLLRRQDRGRFAMFVERLGRGEAFDAAMTDAYATDTRTLELQWRDEVSKRYSWVPVLLGGGVFWVGAFGVIGFGWWRRRRQHRLTLERWAREEAAEDRRRELAARAQTLDEPLATDVGAEARPTPAVMKRTEAGVPMIEHDGRWHTLH